MKIEKEDFDKLKQLDRIEYLERARYIKDNYSSILNYGIPYFNLMLLSGITGMLISIILGLDMLYFMAYFSFAALGLCSFLYIVCFILDIIQLIQRFNSKRELAKRFFNFKTEVKK